MARLITLVARAEVIGTENFLGAFLAHILSLKWREVLHDHVFFAGRLLFILLFFIQIRMAMAVRTEAWTRLMATLLVAVVSGGNAGAAWNTGHSFGFDFKGRWAMTGMTIPQAAATLMVATTADTRSSTHKPRIEVMETTGISGQVRGGCKGLRQAFRARRRMTPDAAHRTAKRLRVTR